jgi:hypothetical protein
MGATDEQMRVYGDVAGKLNEIYAVIARIKLEIVANNPPYEDVGSALYRVEKAMDDAWHSAESVYCRQCGLGDP